jgi:hypothetical protein
MDIQKEFKKYMSDKYGVRVAEMDIIGWKVYEDAFQAGATLMADRVKELEAEIKQDAHGTHSGNTGGQNE